MKTIKTIVDKNCDKSYLTDIAIFVNVDKANDSVHFSLSNSSKDGKNHDIKTPYCYIYSVMSMQSVSFCDIVKNCIAKSIINAIDKGIIIDNGYSYIYSEN